MNDGDGESLRSAPDSVRKFFRDAETPPEWLDYSAFAPGVRMFHRNSQLVLAAFVAGVLIEGFTTNIAKSFLITGRFRDQGVRRLGQNNRHMMEIFLPGSLYRDGDGWKLSVRIRIVHARLRHLLDNSEDWDTEAWGVPISAAHLGYAISAFSARLLKHMKMLGATYNDAEYASFMAVWRYSGYLMGIPETILFQDADEALKLYDIGHMCEPAVTWLSTCIEFRVPYFQRTYRKRDCRITDVSAALLLWSCRVVQAATALRPHTEQTNSRPPPRQQLHEIHVLA